ncbi:MAG: hypothetical protein K0S23_2581 [Fluviicola sp.]|uniref:T9SS type A sorting domain-containing protein n=1 Tax=Fluviicola sp. TaxID=1917219 RepID=UPI0026355501|nr:T9SS type A sorting domain-containing protein [Fluviicola sp.]MDF3028274.1 hypothetical protein [Fluviicola sp.]
MKHLYSLVFLLFALTCSCLSTAQNILPNVSYTNDTLFNCSGTASAAPTGGAGSYSYMWSTGETTSSISNLCAGSYFVVIQDANQDTASFSFSITNPCSNITLSASATNCTPGNCDGTIQLTVTGGSGPYSFSISGGPQTGQPLFSGLCPGTYTVTVTDQNGCMTALIVVVTGNPLSINLETTGDLTGNCVGNAHVTATGGLGPYTYLWSTGETTPVINNLCIGNYSVTVWGANGMDSASASFNITNPCLGFSGYFTSTNASAPGVCDGSTTFTPFGGTPPYYCHWNNGISGAFIYDLCPGNYPLMCEDSNGCMIFQSVTITDSTITISNLSANISAVDDLANNCSGYVSVSPAGGIAPYSYLWSTGLSSTGMGALCAGIYSVTVWDSGSDSTTIDFIIADSSTIYGNNPYPNGPVNDTLYTDLVTNCIIDYSVIDSAALYQAVYDSISQNLYVTWAVYSPTDTVYISDTLGLTGLAPGYYGLTISVYCPNKSGNDFFKIETVIYFDGTAVYFSTLGVDKHALENITIYPNPFTHSVSFDNKNGIIQSVKLVDLNGRVLSEMNPVNSGLVEMKQLESISSGTYLLILSGESSSKTYKVIK